MYEISGFHLSRVIVGITSRERSSRYRSARVALLHIQGIDLAMGGNECRVRRDANDFTIGAVGLPKVALNIRARAVASLALVGLDPLAARLFRYTMQAR